MTQMLRFDGTNDHVTIPTTPAMAGDWDCEFKFTLKVTGDTQIIGTAADTRRIRYRYGTQRIAVTGTTGTLYEIPCAMSVNETATILITSRVSPARLSVYKNGVYSSQLTYTQGIDSLTFIGRSSSAYANMDLYYLRLWDATYDFLWTADGVTSGTVLPEVNSGANGTLVNFVGNPWVDDSLFTLPSTITPLSDFTSTVITPYIDGAAVINFSGVDVNVVITSGQFTTQMPFITSGEVYPVLPISGAITLTQGGNSSTVFRPIVIPAPYDRLRIDDNPTGSYGNFQYIETADDKYIGAHITLTESDTWYFDTTDGYSVDQDSGVNSDTAPRTDIGYLQNTTTGMTTAHNITITPDGGIVVDAEITSVGTVRVGGTTSVTVINFDDSINAGTLDGKALISASNTSITMAGLVDGVATYRIGTRELSLTDGISTADIDVDVLPPVNWSSYVITGSFVEAINGVASSYLPVGWAIGNFILSPNSPSTGKTTTVNNSGILTNNVGVQELFLVDETTGMATAFDITTTAGAGSIGGGGGVYSGIGIGI